MPPPPPCSAVSKTYIDAGERLRSEARWRWLLGALERVSRLTPPYTQGEVADAALLDRPYFSRVVNRWHGTQGDVKDTTDLDYYKVLDGLTALGLPVKSLSLPGQRGGKPRNAALANRCYQVNGYLLGMNHLNRLAGSPHKPIGVVHYFCLRRMMVDPDRPNGPPITAWMKAVARADNGDPHGWAEMDREAVRILPLAVRDADELFPHTLFELTAAERLGGWADHLPAGLTAPGRQYPLPPQGSAFRRFYEIWQPHWTAVDDCIRERVPARTAHRPI